MIVDDRGVLYCHLLVAPILATGHWPFSLHTSTMIGRGSEASSIHLGSMVIRVQKSLSIKNK